MSKRERDFAGEAGEEMDRRRLRAELLDAEEAGDQERIALCLVALGRDIESGCDDDATVIERRRALECRGIIPEHIGADDRARAALEAS